MYCILILQIFYFGSTVANKRGINCGCITVAIVMVWAYSNNLHQQAWGRNDLLRWAGTCASRYLPAAIVVKEVASVLGRDLKKITLWIIALLGLGTAWVGVGTPSAIIGVLTFDGTVKLHMALCGCLSTEVSLKWEKLIYFPFGKFP